MARQSLTKNKAFAMLDRLRAGHDIGDITGKFIDLGVISNDPGDFWQWQVEQARDLIREHRKLKQKTGEIQLELAHLYVVEDDGSKSHYFRPVGRLSTRESVQHVRYWDGRIAKDVNLRQRYFDFHAERLGDPFVEEYEKDEDGPAGASPEAENN